MGKTPNGNKLHDVYAKKIVQKWGLISHKNFLMAGKIPKGNELYDDFMQKV